ncbi:MAG: hypothetical protein HS100_08035 [Anaerolineales bacterium]|nr:hypothetical protein [Anaerolineales bacterium]
MKKLFYATLVLAALLAVTAGTAFAGSALELRSVGNNQGGPTFVFRVTGEFSDSELTGFVQVQGGDDFPLYCSQTSPTEVVCHASKKVGGHDVVVGFGGARFWTYVKEFTPRSYCLSVYDWNFPPPFTQWEFQGTNCSEEAPSAGDSIGFLSPNFGFTPYTYYPGGSTEGFGGATWTPAGPGYYYP